MMPSELRRQVTDVRALRGLANPIRYRLMSHLMAVGAQTASECAAVVGESPSNCSYHLRELARFGFVERVEGEAVDGNTRTDRRDRPWRPTATGFTYGRADDEQATTLEATVQRRFAHAAIAADAELAHAAVEAHDAHPSEWRAAETWSTYGLRVTAAELTELTTAIDRLLRPFIGLTRDDAPAEARPVHALFEAFLRPPAPGAGPASSAAPEPAA
jgi:hypothetical protein